MPAVADMPEIAGRICLPDDVLLQPVVYRLTSATGNIVNRANDICSFNKESLDGDVHNLLMVLQQEQALSLEEALAQATRMHDEEAALFESLRRQLPSLARWTSSWPFM